MPVTEAPSILARVLGIHERRKAELPVGFGEDPHAVFSEVLDAPEAGEGLEGQIKFDSLVRASRDQIDHICREEGLDDSSRVLLMMILLHGRDCVERLLPLLLERRNGTADGSSGELYPSFLLYFQSEILRLYRPGTDHMPRLEGCHSLHFLLQHLLRPQWDYEKVREVLGNHPVFRNQPLLLNELAHQDSRRWRIVDTRDESCSGAYAKKDKTEPVSGDAILVETIIVNGIKFFITATFDGADTTSIVGLPNVKPQLDNLLKWIFNNVLRYMMHVELKECIEELGGFPQDEIFRNVVRDTIGLSKEEMKYLLLKLAACLKFVPRPSTFDISDSAIPEVGKNSWEEAQKKSYARDALRKQLEALLQSHPELQADLARHYFSQYGPSTMFQLSVVAPTQSKGYFLRVGQGRNFLISRGGKVTVIEPSRFEYESAPHSSVEFDPFDPRLMYPHTELGSDTSRRSMNSEQDFIHSGGNSPLGVGSLSFRFEPESTFLLSTNGFPTRGRGFPSAQSGLTGCEDFLGELCSRPGSSAHLVQLITDALSSDPLNLHEKDIGIVVVRPQS